MMSFMRKALAQSVLLSIIAVSAWAQAQVSSADLAGAIFDPSKAVVAGATVTATNVSTGVARSTMSDQVGGYRIALLPPGEYEVRVEMTGFASQRRRGIVLTVGQTAVINFDLQVGAVTTEVEVTAAVPVIETERTH